ncbi:MAG: DUF5131 family protein [Polyangiaceae bacterium]|nr:DUF5131 family protein [Polyangiaceae bacterium]
MRSLGSPGRTTLSTPGKAAPRSRAGCKHCYAETRNERFHGGAHWGVDAPRLMRSESYWREPLKWARAAAKAGERRRVFCSSLADVFEDRPDLEAPRARLFSLIEATPELDWLLLTKRPENMHKLGPYSWRARWPSHVWAGTTAENMEMLRARAEWLRIVPARVKFLSCEPLLEKLELDPPFCDLCGSFVDAVYEDGTPFCLKHERECSFSAVLDACSDEEQYGINWVIVGGESGPKARPCAVEWIESIVRQCAEAGVPCFVKQLGAMSVSEHRPAPSAGLRSKAGADPSEWPEDLRVQEFPR